MMDNKKYRVWTFDGESWYTFRILKTDSWTVRDWCKENLSPMDWSCYSDSSEYMKFSVKGEQLRDLFILRWL